MRTAIVVLALCLAGTLVALTGQERPALPGARTIIDAGRYRSLQAAVDALPPEGGQVRIPPGTFEITEPLRIGKDDVSLVGAGTATHIKNVNASGAAAILIQPPAYAQDRRKRIWRIALADLRVTGNDQSGHGIEAHGVNEIFIHGATVSTHGGDGIHLDNCYEDPRISDSLITYNKKTGLHIQAGHDIVVSGNQFEENLDAVRCLDSFNLCMTGNNLDDHLGDGVVIENTYGSVVSGNMIEECKGTAIVLDRDCYGITLSANVIAHEQAGGIDLRDAHGCAVTGNTFTLVKKNGLRIGPASGRIIVTGNNFSNSYIGDGGQKRAKNDQEAAGIVLDGAADVAVSGNVFSGLSTRALALGGAPARRILFADNVVTEAESDHAALPAGSLVTDNLDSKR